MKKQCNWCDSATFMHTLEKTVYIKFVFFLQYDALLAVEYYLTDVVAAVNKFTMKNV